VMAILVEHSNDSMHSAISAVIAAVNKIQPCGQNTFMGRAAGSQAG
jgi:hypothetical protein